MLIFSLLLLILSALCHAAWNIIARNTRDKITFLWLQMIFMILLLTLPVLILFPLPPTEALPTLLLSGIMQGIYYLLLAKTYTLGDIEVVYPLTRGSAPVFVCLFSFLLGLEKITLPMFLSVLLIFAGIYIINMEQLDKYHLMAPFRTIIQNPPVRLSLLNGIIVSIYSLSDSISIKYCSPIVVYYIIAVIPAVILLPLILKRGKLKSEIQNGTGRIAAVSVLTFAAYALVLFAMQFTSASYSSSVREMSIIFVSLYSCAKMNRTSRIPKILGAFLIFSGVFLLSLFRM